MNTLRMRRKDRLEMYLKGGTSSACGDFPGREETKEGKRVGKSRNSLKEEYYFLKWR